MGERSVGFRRKCVFGAVNLRRGSRDRYPYVCMGTVGRLRIIIIIGLRESVSWNVG